MIDNQSGVRLGRFFGIDVFLQPTWFLIFGIYAYILFQDTADSGHPPAVRLAYAVVLAVGLFASIVAHEYGHALTARHFGIETERISLHLFGGVAQIRSEPRRPAHEFWIAIAGPLVSLALAVVLGAAALGAHLSGADGLVRSGLAWGGAINLALFVFNLLPGFPMDGGRILRSAVWAMTGNFLRATNVAAMGGRLVGAGLIGLGIAEMFITRSLSGLLLALLGFYLMRLAKVSNFQAEVQTLFDNTRVRDFMRPVSAVVPADATVGELVDRYFRLLRFQDELPVVREDRLAGFVTRADAEGVEPRQRDWTRVSEITSPVDRSMTVHPDQESLSALQEIARTRRASLPVFEDRRLVGFLFHADLAHYVNLRRSRRA